MYISIDLLSKKETAIQEESCMTAVLGPLRKCSSTGLHLLRGIIQLQ